MFIASNVQLKELVSLAEKLSYHYKGKYQNLDFSELNSIAQEAVADSLTTYDPIKGYINSWASHYIYSRFKDLLKELSRQPKLREKAEITDFSPDIVENLLCKVQFTKKEKEAVLYFLKYKEPPPYPNNLRFYSAVKKARQFCTCSP